MASFLVYSSCEVLQENTAESVVVYVFVVLLNILAKIQLIERLHKKLCKVLVTLVTMYVLLLKSYFAKECVIKTFKQILRKKVKLTLIIE